MESLFCLFCARANPGDANFCNECGTPLHLKPCRQCDAVNARLADRCYRCEAALPTESVAVDGEASAARLAAAAAEMGEQKRTESLQEQPADPPVFTTASTALAEPIAPEREQASLDEQLDVVARAFGTATAVHARPAPAPTAPPAAAVGSRVATPPSNDDDQRGPAAQPSTEANDASFGVVTAPDVDDSEAVRWHVDTDRLPGNEPSPSTPEPYRPPRPRGAIAALVALIALGAAAAVYVGKHPDALERLGLRRAEPVSTGPARDAAVPTPEPAKDAPAAAVQESPPPAAAATQPPSPQLATTPPAPATEAAGSPAAVAAPTTAPVPPSTAAAVPPPSAAPARPPTAAQAPPPAAAAAGTRSASREARTRNERSRTESREAAQSARSRGASAQRSTCTPQVAALGLCTP